MSDYILCHHGIKGQKWGVRRFQKKDGSLTSAGKRRYSEDARKSKDEEKNRPRLSEKQKRYLKVGAAFTATALVSYGGYKLYNSKILTTGGKAGYTLKSKKTNMSMADDLAMVNRKFKLGLTKYKMNCGNCSIAYELRRRGYDVEALGNKNGMFFSQIGQFFTDLKSDSYSQVFIEPGSKGAAVRDAISKKVIEDHPDGARGTIFFTHKLGNHFFNWEKVNGKVIFTDAQSNDLGMDWLFDMYEYKSFEPVTCVRLDNLNINTDNISSIVKNVGERAKGKFDSQVTKGKDFVMKEVF